MNKNLVGLLVAAALFIGGYALHIMAIEVVGAFAFAAFFVVTLREQSKEDAAGRVEIRKTDAQLRSDLVATLERAFTELADADEATRTKVAELLAEAGMHLGNPYTNSRVVYGNGYFVNWNQQGIDLVGQAKQVIDAHVAARKA